MRLSTHNVMHKFILDLKEEGDGIYSTEVDMPSHAEIRKLDMRGNDVCIWVQVDNEIKGRQTRKFLMIGTGREFNALKFNTHVATFFDAQWVWHLFEAKS